MGLDDLDGHVALRQLQDIVGLDLGLPGTAAAPTAATPATTTPADGASGSTSAGAGGARGGGVDGRAPPCSRSKL